MWWLLAAAFAAAPDGVMAEDAESWVSHAEVLRSGPEGCFEVVGRATWDWDLGKRGGTRGSAAFVGKYEDGVWLDMLIKSLGEDTWRRNDVPVRVYPHGEMTFAPLVGTIPQVFGEARGQSFIEDIVKDITHALDTSESYPWSEWSDDKQAVVLHQVVPFGTDGRGPEATIDAYFPQGDTVPQHLSIEVGSISGVSGWRGAKVRRVSGHVRGVLIDDVVFLTVESLSFEATSPRATLIGSQTIRYLTYRACGASIDDEITAIQP
jgi:hypothetical protein